LHARQPDKGTHCSIGQWDRATLMIPFLNAAIAKNHGDETCL
jgi:hypothetical protein